MKPLPALAAILLTLAGPALADDPANLPYARVEVLLSGNQTVAGETIVYPADQAAQVTAAVVTLLPGEETGWHTHGVPLFGYILEGVLVVDYGELGERTYHQGDGFLEAMAFRHNGHNRSDAPVRILAVYMGGEASRNTTPE